MATMRVFEATDRHEQLLPGIPDEITLNGICTKLPWRAVNVLSSVSPRWQRAIRSRQVYEARVRSHSTETLAILGRQQSYSVNGFFLYSVRDKACYRLPWNPQLEGVLPRTCKCVSSDGKMYVVGRMTPISGKGGKGGKGVEVCVLDVAGQRGWDNCADMQAPRIDFGCGVLHGKIYVVGGTDGSGHESGPEVYDPDTNVWSRISPMESRLADYNVSALGEELYVYGGHRHSRGYGSSAVPLEIYHPIKNEWRHVDPWSTLGFISIFMSHGKFYGVGADGIYVHDDDIERCSWTMFKPGFLRYYCGEFVAVGEEVLDVPHQFRRGGSDSSLRQSKGFGSTTKELVWEIVNIPLSSDSEDWMHFMGTVEL